MDSSFSIHILKNHNFQSDWFYRINPLEPLGFETEEPESLSSYVLRLASSHSMFVTPFLQQTILENDSKHMLTPRRLYSINGYSPLPTRASQGLKALSILEFNFDRLTFIPLKEISDSRGHNICRHTQQWCPLCWQEDLKNKIAAYSRLLWTTTVVQTCPIHKCFLLEKCETCGEEQHIISQLPVQGICQSCGADLAFQSNNSLHPSERQLWDTNSIQRLIIRCNVEELEIQKNTFQYKLQQIINTHCNGNRSLFEKRTGLSRGYIHKWLKTGVQPSLRMLLEFCYRINIPLDSLLLDSLDLTHPDLWSNPSPINLVETKKISKQRLRTIRYYLESEIVNPSHPPKSLGYVSEKLRVSKEVLKYHFPVQCTDLKALREKWDHQERLRVKQKRKIRVGNAVKILLKRGQRISERNLRAIKGFVAADLRHPEIKEYLSFYRG